MEPEYRLENGQYAFYLDGERRFATEEVAILFDNDTEMSVLHKHGSPELVDKAFGRMRLALSDDPAFNHMADSLTVIRGKFDVEELNKVVQISGYVGRFYSRLQRQAGEAQTSS